MTSNNLVDLDLISVCFMYTCVPSFQVRFTRLSMVEMELGMNEIVVKDSSPAGCSSNLFFFLLSQPGGRLVRSAGLGDRIFRRKVRYGTDLGILAQELCRITKSLKLAKNKYTRFLEAHQTTSLWPQLNP